MDKLRGALLIAGLSLSLIGEEGFKGGMGGPCLAVSFFDAKELNARLKAHNIEELSTQQTCFGGGGSGIIGKVILGGWGFGGGEEVESESVKVKVDYGGGFFEPGYYLPITQNLGLSILLGLGGYGYSLNLTPTSLSGADFDTLLTGPGARRTSNISAGGLSLSIGGGFLFLIPFEEAFIGLNVKGGYIFSPMKREWELEDGGTLRGAPKLNLNGPFISIGLVFGGKEEKL